MTPNQRTRKLNHFAGLLAASLIVISLAAALSAREAWAQGWATPGDRKDFVSRSINQRIQGFNTLRVRELLGLGEQFRGRRVEYVVLNASTDFGRGQAQLLINNGSVGIPQLVSTWTQDHFFYPERFRDTLGQDIQTLQLQLNGNFFVNSLSVKLAPGFERPGAGNDFLQIPVNRFFYGNQALSIRELLPIGREHRGKEVQSIIVRARAETGYGSRFSEASLLIDGFATGAAQSVGSFTSDLRFLLPMGRNVIDEDIRRMELELHGGVFIESIAVEFKANDRVISASVRQMFDGENTLRLRQLLDLNRLRGRRIQSVILVAQADYSYANAQLLVNGVQTGSSQSISRFLQQHVFRLPFSAEIGTDIQRLQLQLSGRVFVESVAVEAEN